MESANELTSFTAETAADLAVANEAVVALTRSATCHHVPHMAEVLLAHLGLDPLTLSCPSVDQSALVQDTITMVVQVNGKIRGQLEVAPNSDATA